MTQQSLGGKRIKHENRKEREISIVGWWILGAKSACIFSKTNQLEHPGTLSNDNMLFKSELFKVQILKGSYVDCFL